MAKRSLVTRHSSLVTFLGLALVLTGCKTGHVSYSLDSVRPVPGSHFAQQSLYVEKFVDSRYKDRKSVSYYVHKSGSYGAHNSRGMGYSDKGHSTGLRPTPEMSD